MKRDEQLLHKLLLLAEGEKPEPDLSKYSGEQQAYHSAILIDSGLVDGETIKDENGQVCSAVLLDLTPAGHDLLERRREAIGPAKKVSSEAIEIFISHSQIDQDLAKALIELLMEALDVSRTAIRCTSVIGHKLKGGTPIEQKLRQEINGSKIFLGLLTSSSLASTYVMFELGARWGCEKPWYLVKARGMEIKDLGGPLPAYHITDASSENDMAQMIEDMANDLGKIPQSFAALQEKIKIVVSLSTALLQKGPKIEESSTDITKDENDILATLTAWIGGNLYSLDNRVITFSKLDSELSLQSGASAKHLERVAVEKGATLIRRGKETILFESPAGVW